MAKKDTGNLDWDAIRKYATRSHAQYQAESIVPQLDEAGNVVGFYDKNDPTVPENQPNTQRLQAHLLYLNRNKGYQPQVGQQIPDFQLADPYQSEGFFDSAGNVGQMAVNESILGLLKEAATGSPVFDMAGFEPTGLESTVAGIGSFVPDLPIFLAGGGLGGAAVKGLAGQALKQGVKRVAAEAGAFGLHGALKEGLTRGIGTGEYTPESFVEGGAKGLALGTAAGVAGAGVRAAFAGRATKKAMAVAEKEAEEFAKTQRIKGGLYDLAKNAETRSQRLTALRGAREAVEGVRTNIKIEPTRGQSFAEFGAEVAVFGGVSPFIEGRAPTADDFINAAAMVAGFRATGLIYRAAKSKLSWDKIVNKEAADIQEEVAKGKDFNEVVAAKIGRDMKNKVNEPMVDMLKTLPEGTKAGVVGDYIIGTRLREKLKESLDIPILIDNSELARKDAVKFGRYNSETNTIHLSNKDPNLVLGRLIEEATHGVRVKKGRSVPDIDPETVTAAEYAALPQESSARRMVDYFYGHKEALPIPIEERTSAKRFSEKVANQRRLDALFMEEYERKIRPLEELKNKYQQGGMTLEDYNKARESIGMNRISESQRAMEKARRVYTYDRETEQVTGAYKALQESNKQESMRRYLKKKQELSTITDEVERRKALDDLQKRYEQETRLRIENRASLESEPPTIKGKGFTATPSVPPDRIPNRDKINRLRRQREKFMATKAKGGKPKTEVIAHEGGQQGQAYSLAFIEKDGKKVFRLNSASNLSTAIDAIKRVEKRNANLYFDKKFEKTKMFLRLKNLGYVSAERVGGRYKAIPSSNVSRETRGVDIDDLRRLRIQELRSLSKITDPTIVGNIKKAAHFVTPEFIKQTENRLPSDEGKRFSYWLKQGMAEQMVTSGSFMEEAYENGLKLGMSKKDGDAMAVAMQNGTHPSMARLMDRVWDEMRAVGIKIGKQLNYLPRMLKDEYRDKLRTDLNALEKELGDKSKSDQAVILAIKRKGELFNAAIEAILEENPNMTMTQALRILNREVRSNFFVTASFEKKRTNFNLPADLYETDARIILPRYFEGAAKRIAEAKIWGPQEERAYEMLEALEKVSPEQRRVAEMALKQWTGEIEIEKALGHEARKWVDRAGSLQVITKIGLGFASIYNVGQSAISTMLDLGVWNFLKGGTELAMNTEAAKKRNIGSGALSHDLMLAVAGWKPGGRLGAISDFLLKWSGFKGINRLNQHLAATTFEIASKQWIELANGTGKRAEWARKRLADFDIDYKAVTERDIRKGMARFATDSQLQKNVLADPLSRNDPRVRPLWLFKGFGYRQAAYIKDIMTREIERGNMMPLIRLGTVGVAGGAGMLWAVNGLKSWMSGEPQYAKHDTGAKLVINNLAAIGALGMIGDMLRVDKASTLGKTLKWTIMPVYVSDVEKVLEAHTKVMEDWENYGDKWLVTKRNMYHPLDIAGPIARQFGKRTQMDEQVADRQKFLKTKERTEIINLIIDGNGDGARKRIKLWNEHYKDAPMTMNDVSLSTIADYLERQIEKRKNANVGEKGKLDKETMMEERSQKKKLLDIARQQGVVIGN